ncbi:MAG: polysaccharide pyruvyl transferase CsaB [Oscillatoriales cyanobacterium SM2_2_1]|nr:polysaccharide pyruvyl transferase CsaB [Oscillatoriales cyanobacterium SM2_2_1]
MLRAVLSGYYGMGNGGDEALLATLLQMLPPSVKPLVLSARPQVTELLHQVEATDRYSALGVPKALRQSDWFIWGGGSLMQDATSIRNPLYYGGLMGLAKNFDLRTIAWAQGVGPLRHRSSQWIARQAFHQCDRISVRDQASASLLQEWHIESTLAPDPVWALSAESVPELSSLPAPRVAVVLRAHPQLNESRLQLLIRALDQLQRATATHLLVIPFQPSQDRAIAEAIVQQIPQRSQLILEDSPRRLKGLFRGVELVIAMRLHALIMAAAEGARCWALSYDPKVDALMAELPLPGCRLSELPRDAAPLSREWMECLANGEPLLPETLDSLGDRAAIHQQLFLPDPPQRPQMESGKNC